MKKISAIPEHLKKEHDLKIKYKEKKAELETVIEDQNLAEYEKIQLLDRYHDKESIKNENIDNKLKQTEDKLSEINNKKYLLENEMEYLKNQLRKDKLENILNSPESEQDPLEDDTEINPLEYSNDESKDNKGYDSYSEGYDGYDDDYDTYNSYNERLLQSMSTNYHQSMDISEIVPSEKNNSKIKSDNILPVNNPTIFS